MAETTTTVCSHRRLAARLVAALAITLMIGRMVPAQSRTSAGQLRNANRLKVYQRRHADLLKTFRSDVESIAQYCLEHRLNREVGALRQYAKAVGTEEFRSGELPSHVQPAIARDFPEAERQWRTRLRKARNDYAIGLYRLTRDAIFAGFASFGYELLQETARVNPDHIAARRLLGYVRSGNSWITPFEKRKADLGEVWHDRYGWLPKSSVKRYEDGERYYVPRGARKGRWIAANVDAQLHRDFNNAWKIETEHYLVKTNVSYEEGVRVAKTLEDYYRYFFQTFAGFFNSREQMRKLFSGSATRGGRARSTPYVVHYYRTKDEYVKRLQPFFPGVDIGITNALYLTRQRIAHFYHNPDVDNTPTLYHEATHQIFYESLKNNRTIAEREHFWIIEGISCYVESFRKNRGRASFGDPAYERFRAAKIRFVNDGYYVPLSRFAQLGMQAFQTNRNIQKNYSQASGLTKFFMEYDNGRYRDALIEHISQLYRNDTRRFARGKALRVQTLEELTGVSYKKLDRQYGAYIRALPVRNFPTNTKRRAKFQEPK